MNVRATQPMEMALVLPSERVMRGVQAAPVEIETKALDHLYGEAGHVLLAVGLPQARIVGGRL